MKISGK